MSSKRGVDDYSVDELEQILYRKKRAHRRQRLDRLKAEGRVVEVDGLEPPDASHQFDSQPKRQLVIETAYPRLDISRIKVGEITRVHNEQRPLLFQY